MFPQTEYLHEHQGETPWQRARDDNARTLALVQSYNIARTEVNDFSSPEFEHKAKELRLLDSTDMMI
jgi:hypothetical protein